MCIGNTVAQVGPFCFFLVQISSYIIWYTLPVEKLHWNLDFAISHMQTLNSAHFKGFQKHPNDSRSNAANLNSMYMFILIRQDS